MVDDKCSLSNPLLHHLLSLSLSSVSTSSARFLFPYPGLAQQPAECWLLFILLLALTTFLTLQSLKSALSSFALFRLISCLCLFCAFLLFSISHFIFAPRSVSFLFLFISTFSSHPFSLVPCLFRFSPKLPPYFDSFSPSSSFFLHFPVILSSINSLSFSSSLQISPVVTPCLVCIQARVASLMRGIYG